MTAIYEQDCGTYSIVLEPAYSFLSVEQTGAVGSIHNHLYHDQITLSSNDVNDIGRYSVTIRVTQITDDGDGFTDPYVGKMPDMTKEFLVTINPCDETLAVGTAVSDMAYTIGDDILTGTSYAWSQVCGYNIHVEVIDLPGFAVHDETNSQFVIDSSQDRALVGDYSVTV